MFPLDPLVVILYVISKKTLTRPGVHKTQWEWFHEQFQAFKP